MGTSYINVGTTLISQMYVFLCGGRDGAYKTGDFANTGRA